MLPVTAICSCLMLHSPLALVSSVGVNLRKYGVNWPAPAKLFIGAAMTRNGVDSRKQNDMNSKQIGFMQAFLGQAAVNVYEMLETVQRVDQSVSTEIEKIQLHALADSRQSFEINSRESRKYF
ncbi:hypothetical protein C8R42DRAFT_648137 [Lentinula raphanica]|nr:hypothetical protein C8R42DRAFT_648137 [Lentinula raphanica]